MTNFEQWLKAAMEQTNVGSVDGAGDDGIAFIDPKKKKKKNENKYDGRTREAKKFVERLLAKRAAREEAKKNAQ